MRFGFASLCFASIIGLAACGGETPGGPAVPASTTLNVTNRLLIPIELYVNGSSIGRVSASSAQQFDLGSIDTLHMEWDMVCQTMPDGEPVGYEGGGVFSTIRTTGAVKNVTIDNEIGSSIYFTPAMTNTSNENIKIVVNEGLTSEIQCPLTIAAGAQGVNAGYYRLYNGTTVRGYLASSNYSGKCTSWKYGLDFSLAAIEDGSGRLPLACKSVGETGQNDAPAMKAAPYVVARRVDDLTGERESEHAGNR